MKDSLFAYFLAIFVILFVFYLILIFNDLNKPKNEIYLMIDTYGKYKRI